MYINFKYLLTILLFTATFPVSILARSVNYSDLPDSSRMQIRLKSFILIQPEGDLPDSLLFSKSNILLAFSYNSDFHSEILKKINTYSSLHPQILLISKEIPDIPENINAEIIIYDPYRLDTIVLHGDSINLQSYDTCLSINELLMVDISLAKANAKSACFNVWKQSGKLPNFIQADSSEINMAAQIVSAVNDTFKIFGVVYENRELLPGVYWENSTNTKTYGYFSFPITQFKFNRLIPYKAGYQFSPDIIQRSGSNLNNMKEFHAIKYEPEFGLKDHFTFNNKIKNERRENYKSFITNGVQYKKDADHGMVAYFANRAYIDVGLQSEESLKNNFSITARIKPTLLTFDKGIIGKGSNFILKIRNGKLTFTMAGIKDYISDNSIIPIDTWSHIAMVYSKFNNHIDFFINGKHTDRIRLIADYEDSDNSILIGSNLWEEFYVGYLKEIKIWNRELNSEEIKFQYLEEEHNSINKYGLITGLLFAISLGIFFLLKKRHKKKSSQTKTKNRPLKNYRLNFDPKGEGIQCFGGLKVIDSKGNDIGQKFSPKLKQLFTLIFLHSQGRNNGITSKQLTEILWSGMSMSKAKNIRGTYIQNLRSALSPFNNIKLVFEDKNWHFDFTNDFYDEYVVVENVILALSTSQELVEIEKQLPTVIDIVKKGRFLERMEESWLDPFIEKMNSRIVEFCLELFTVLDNTKHTKLLLDLSEVISINDPLNEIALQKKIMLLVEQGKLSIARSIFDNFKKLYKELYKEDYSTDFKVLVAGKSNLV